MGPLCKLPWGRLPWMASMVLGGPSFFRSPGGTLADLLLLSPYLLWLPVFSDLGCKAEGEWLSLPLQFHGESLTLVTLQICHHPCSVHWGCHHHPGHLHGPSALICTWEQTISSWQTSLYGFRSHKHWSRQICPGGQWGLCQMMISRTGTIKSIYHFVKERCLSGHSNFLPMAH